jgi:hypothetical protein
MGPRVTRALKYFVAPLAALALSALAASFWCSETRQGRRFVARRIEQLVTSNIPGRLEIGELTRLDGPHVSARNVRFFHPDGRCLLAVDSATVELALADALHGRLGFRSVAADGGYMSLAADPDGRLAFEATVNAAAKPGEPSDPHGGLHYELRAMHVQNFSLLVQLSNDPYRIRNVSGFVGVYRVDTPGVQVKLERIRGDVTPEILGQHVRLEDLHGWVHGKERKVAQGEVALRIGSDPLTTRVEYFDREKNKVNVHVERQSGVAAATVTLLIRFAAGLSDEIRIEG